MSKRTNCESEKERNDGPTKKIALPPPPLDFLGSSAARSLQKKPEDDPTKHNGRQRQFEHVEGNFATFVYIPVHYGSELEEAIQSIIQETNEDLLLNPRTKDFVVTPLKPDEIHVSLSRTVPIRHHFIKPLKELTTKHIEPFKKFSFAFSKYRWFTNDTKTTTFLCLEIISGAPQVNALIEAVNKSFKSFAFPEYYENPIPHITIGFIPQDITMHLESLSGLLQATDCVTLPASHVVFRSGKTESSITLQ
eukprot:TRINITY_DN4806_c0_g3_i1.p1 TRINITY_DN4806_c0_g3~~TRINITY_DN4806_c0_g3_i1.p1  ORF type:complete len:250 (-),score=39.03 TRINITY_DN4806_c0_g3_i1:23-772(-)